MAAAIAFPAPELAEASASGWQEIQEVPCWLTAQIPVAGFKVRDLLLLKPGSVVNSKQSTSSRVELQANGSFLAWAEFETIDGRLGVRLTDLG
jgi:flagellar motor switch/type III secretory pathway protein FliN